MTAERSREEQRGHHAVQIGDRHAKPDEREHVQAAISDGLDGADEEGPSTPENHGSRQGELEPDDPVPPASMPGRSPALRSHQQEPTKPADPEPAAHAGKLRVLLLVLSPVRGSSAIPQIGQFPGASRTICGCIGQVHSVRWEGRGVDGSSEAAFPTAAAAYRSGSEWNFTRHPAEQKRNSFPFQVSRWGLDSETVIPQTGSRLVGGPALGEREGDVSVLTMSFRSSGLVVLWSGWSHILSPPATSICIISPPPPFCLGIVVGRVVRDVAVDHPLPGLERRPDHVVALAGSDVDRVGLESCRGSQRLAVARHHHERTAVNMHRMNEAAVRPDEPNLERLADFHPDRVGRREGASVDREEVRLATIHRHRRIRQAFAYQPLLKLNRVFVIGAELVRRICRIDDERAIQSQ